MAQKQGVEARRKARVRRAIRKVANGRPRLSVFRSSKQIYAQVIDDAEGRTLAAASTLEKDLRSSL
jgi:large subunit ribosomal protein L18